MLLHKLLAQNQSQAGSFFAVSAKLSLAFINRKGTGQNFFTHANSVITNAGLAHNPIKEKNAEP